MRRQERGCLLGTRPPAEECRRAGRGGPGGSGSVKATASYVALTLPLPPGPIVQTLKRIPCASGSSELQLMVFVWRRMYAFQESEPASRPPPVSFSPPNAPPISAPEVPRLTLAIPQSLPSAERKRSATCNRSVKTAEDRP